MEDANLIRRVLALISADNLDKWERLIREAEDSLLSLEADALLEQMHAQSSEGDALRTTIELRRGLLRRCRENGITAAFAMLRGPAEADEAVTPAAKKKLEQMQQMIDQGDPEETMMHPDVYRAVVLKGVLRTYDAMLESQRNSPLDYGQTQLNRAKVLHQLAGLKGEHRANRLHEALTAYNDALQVQENAPRDLARTQSNRALLLYQLAVLPGEDHIVRLREALSAYEEALTRMEDNPHLYAKTQLNRVALLRDMAGLPGENRAQRLHEALVGFNRVLEAQAEDTPLDYARTQLPRANLLRELAGLRGEDRDQWMAEALKAYDEALTILPENTVEHALTEINRASLLQEIATLEHEDRQGRLREAMQAAVKALTLLNQAEHPAQHRTAMRMLTYTRRNIVEAEGEDTFNQWWADITTLPQPEWTPGTSVKA